MFESVGATELIIILFALLIMFGGKKLPELARGLGKGIKEFKKSVSDINDSINIKDNK